MGPKSSAEHTENHANTSASRQNWLRAAVLGANDGIVSVAALVVGVSSAYQDSRSLLTVGIAGLLAGALSMSVGEYISVSSQRDTERSLLAKERKELTDFPEQERDELAGIYEKKGLSKETAMTVANELMQNDAFAAHADAELGIDPDKLTSPWQAAFASAVSFTVGALIPLIAVLLPPTHLRIPVTFGAVVIALVITGILSAKASGAPLFVATSRVVLGGMVAMAITFEVGTLFGVTGI